jgi:aminoglycoside phosphotransferase (APT) family kinase protein
MTSAIPRSLRAEIERQTGAVIAEERARGGGGASRQGAEVMLRGRDGERRCYLAWDTRAADPLRRPFFERETAVLAALSGPLAGSGVRVAPLLATSAEHLALLSVFVPGEERFAAAAEPVALARDFMAQLAALHRVDPAHPALAALGDATELPSAAIRRRLARLKADNLARAPDPILQLALVWLEENVPEDRGPAAVLHGDAGPGNFLHCDNRVAALVDWEFTHLGDPMEDLAQIWVRSLIQPFVPMREVFSAYHAAGGAPADLPRVKYHRLYFQLGFCVAGHAALYATDAAPVSSLGSAMMYGTMHKRVIVRSLAEFIGVAPDDPSLPACVADWTDRGFAAALDDLRNEITPSLSSQRATAKAKDLARLVKFWRARARCGSAYDAAEVAEIRAVLPTAPDGLLPARAALAIAIAEDRIERRTALQLCHNRMVRETALMADAMGSLATTYYEALD